MKLPPPAFALLALSAACKESRPSGLTGSDVPIVIGDSGPGPIDVPLTDIPSPGDRPSTDVPPGNDTGVLRDTGPLVEEPFRPIAPQSGAYVRSLRPTFRWSELRGATSYRVEFLSLIHISEPTRPY